MIPQQVCLYDSYFSFDVTTNMKGTQQLCLHIHKATYSPNQFTECSLQYPVACNQWPVPLRSSGRFLKRCSSFSCRQSAAQVGTNWRPGQFNWHFRMCSVCSVQCTVCSVQCAVCSVQCAVCSVQYTVCSVYCVVCSVQCAVCSVQCVVCSVICSDW